MQIINIDRWAIRWCNHDGHSGGCVNVDTIKDAQKILACHGDNLEHMEINYNPYRL